MHMRTGITACFVLALAASTQATPRDDVQSYLESVYAAVSASQWSALSDDDIFGMYDNLTFYYENNPQSPTWTQRWPQGRDESHLYASTECDCLHLQLQLCKNKTQGDSCPYWPMKTFTNMDFVLDHKAGVPSNAWFEGLSFPGEWGFPITCTDSSMSHSVYAWHQHMWLYPVTGTGVWFNSGNTASAANKVAWLLTFGQGDLGSNTVEVMDKLASTVCPGYRTLTQCEQCADPSDPTKCCCHGAGQNLGTQVVDVKTTLGLSSWDDALNTTASYYLDAMTGQEDTSTYPKGTYFCIRDLLDHYLFELSSGYDSLQFYREPQHYTGSWSSTTPAYAMEALALNQGAYSWSSFCGSEKFGVLDPTADLAAYTTKGYIPASKTSSPLPLSAFKPRKEFAALIKLKSETYTAAQLDANIEGPHTDLI